MDDAGQIAPAAAMGMMIFYAPASRTPSRPAPCRAGPRLGVCAESCNERQGTPRYM
jgi:hypothetical protein